MSVNGDRGGRGAGRTGVIIEMIRRGRGRRFPAMEDNGAEEADEAGEKEGEVETDKGVDSQGEDGGGEPDVSLVALEKERDAGQIVG